MNAKTKVHIILAISCLGCYSNIKSSELASHTKRKRNKEQLEESILSNAANLALLRANSYEGISSFVEDLQKKLKVHLQEELPIEIQNQGESFLLTKDIADNSVTIRDMKKATKEEEIPIKLENVPLTRRGIFHLEKLIDGKTELINTEEDYDNLMEALRAYDFLKLQYPLSLAKKFNHAEVLKIVKFLQQNCSEYSQLLLNTLFYRNLYPETRQLFYNCSKLDNLDVFDLEMIRDLSDYFAFTESPIFLNYLNSFSIFGFEKNRYAKIDKSIYNEIYETIEKISFPTFLDKTTFSCNFKLEETEEDRFGIFSLEKKFDFKEKYSLIKKFEIKDSNRYGTHATKNGNRIFIFKNKSVIVLDEKYNPKNFSLNIRWNMRDERIEKKELDLSDYVEHPFLPPNSKMKISKKIGVGIDPDECNNEPIALDEKTYLLISDRKLFKVSFDFENSTVFEEKILELDKDIVNLYKLTDEIFILKVAEKQEKRDMWRMQDKRQKELIAFNVNSLKCKPLRSDRSWNHWLNDTRIKLIIGYRKNEVIIGTGIFDSTRIFKLTYNMGPEGLPDFNEEMIDLMPFRCVCNWKLDTKKENLFGILISGEDDYKKLIKIPLKESTQSNAATSSNC